MDTKSVNISLDLNLNPLHRIDELAPQAASAGALAEELNRISTENKKLAQKLTAMCESYNALQNHFREMISKNPDFLRKRKPDSEDYNSAIGFTNNGNTECSSSDEDSYKWSRAIKSKLSRVCVRTDSSNTSLLVKDGYQWRKYGQKVTRDNPSPRAYFKCSFAPSCPVKKKVQRSAEDPSLLVATYEGEHNHIHPSQAEISISPSQAAKLVSSSSLPISAASTISNNRSLSTSTLTLNLMEPALGACNTSTNTSSNNMNAKLIAVQENINEAAPAGFMQQFLVKEMASSLTRDPNFTAALASAISERMVDLTHMEKW
ncbi:probable WRKY transcription factor 40 isoform X1 [Ziziphus jujuba]|uniref:Probable WRKY transcription factor 40 isoform X1 n=1 Tax=Ziziphus jujuba TaxID=326968 RepID=A0A6P3ZX99_ZIZJJ|nr:probable WRKY transcription factor 40 isoform X1 [Ziziphus jujuba]